ncbi:class I SAM-dependent RNA methyltransferase [Amnibacterium flavum]|uniref:23S rRNA methyltransferase n=1 Tax=Amnibacterium flavum TaxID=2173173 RepID=A0A2V1HY76_9MICO|nr:class I SAM-dependent RNA methyltransferase [Amnibacterium flavum]PVZ96370.1 23S rRNA methyltransferase [Amnibacterium flavum]
MSAAVTGPSDADDELVQLDVTGVAHGGVFVARHEGRVVFVSDTMPGEHVLARVTDRGHDRFWRAETVEILLPSADRREHFWPEAAVDRDPAARPGGAEFGHIAPRRQRDLKRDVLVDSLRRFGGIEDAETIVPAVTELPGSPDGAGWRTRVRLQVDADGLVGPYAARSHHVVEVRDIPLAVEALREAAPLGIPHPGASAIDMVASSTGQVHVTVGEGRPSSDGTLTEVVGDREFRLARHGFWQVHPAAAATLTRAVQEAIDGQVFDPAAANLDLYGGVGLLAAAVGDRFGPATRITSVESDGTATAFAARNLGDWSGAAAETARVDRYVADLERRSGRADRERISRSTVVLDPPRSGAGKAVMRTLGRLAPAQLVYVACDPVALARDIGFAREAGYRLTALTAFDLFPSTHHVEAVATLVR